MIIKVKNIRRNPYRNLELNPLDEDKIRRLQESYRKFGFWNNTPVVKHPTKKDIYIQIYGAHRLEALTRSGIDEVDLEVLEYDNIDLSKILDVENDNWQHNTTKTMVENIYAVKKSMEDEIVKADWDYHKLPDKVKMWFDGEFGFEQFKKNSIRAGQKTSPPNIGRNILKQYFGTRYSDNDIKLSLKLLFGETEVISSKESKFTGETTKAPIKVKVSREAAEKFDKAGQSRTFVESITKDPVARAMFGNPDDQIKLADDIIKETFIEQKIQAEQDNKPIPKEPRLTGTIIKEKIYEKAQESLNEHDEIGPEIEKTEFAYAITKESEEIPNAIKETLYLYKKIVPNYDKMETKNFQKGKYYAGLPDPSKMRVYTKKMAQKHLDMLLEIQYHLQKYRKGIEEATGLQSNLEVINWDHIDIIADPEDKEDVFEEEVDKDKELTIEQEKELDEWINKLKNKNDKEN